MDALIIKFARLRILQMLHSLEVMCPRHLVVVVHFRNI